MHETIKSLLSLIAKIYMTVNYSAQFGELKYFSKAKYCKSKITAESSTFR